MSGTMTIEDHRKIGRLFISMAKGETPVPETSEEAIKVLAGNGVTIKGYTAVIFHQNDPTTLHLVVADGEAISRSEEMLGQSNQGYAVPENADTIYKQHYLMPERPDDLVRKRELFEARIGDYSVATCM